MKISHCSGLTRLTQSSSWLKIIFFFVSNRIQVFLRIESSLIPGTGRKEKRNRRTELNIRCAISLYSFVYNCVLCQHIFYSYSFVDSMLITLLYNNDIGTVRASLARPQTC